MRGKGYGRKGVQHLRKNIENLTKLYLLRKGKEEIARRVWNGEGIMKGGCEWKIKG